MKDRSELLIVEKPRLQFGDILLETDDKRLSKLGWLIQSVLGQPYCHSGMYMEDGLFIEALYNGIQTNKIEDLGGSLFTVLRFKGGLSLGDKIRIKTKAFSVLGRPYDFCSAASVACKMMARRMGMNHVSNRLTPDPLDAKDRFFCFQLTAWLYEELQIIAPHWTNAVGLDFLASNKLEVVCSDYSFVELQYQKEMGRKLCA